MLRDWTESKLNREKVGEDRFGNEYYQYYSHYGLPTRKEIRYVNWNRAKSIEDVHFFPWLRSQEFLPPTEEGLKLLYIQDKERRLKAIKYNKESKELDDAYYQNGVIALEMILKNEYDLVLMDLVMPNMNGLEATQKIRNEFASPKNQIKILALTASVVKFLFLLVVATFLLKRIFLFAQQFCFY